LGTGRESVQRASGDRKGVRVCAGFEGMRLWQRKEAAMKNEANPAWIQTSWPRSMVRVVGWDAWRHNVDSAKSLRYSGQRVREAWRMSAPGSGKGFTGGRRATHPLAGSELHQN
jgi:hypothetical protein